MDAVAVRVRDLVGVLHGPRGAQRVRGIGRLVLRGVPVNRYVSLAGLAVVALAAAVLSFASLRSLAVVCGTPVQLAWLVPIAVDAAAVTATWVWLAPDSPTRARSTARALSLGTLALSITGNAADHVIAAFGIVPPVWAVIAVAAVPPAVLGAVAHLAALALPRQATPDHRQAEPDGDQGEPGDLAARAAALLAAGAAEGVKIGRGRIARELGIPESQARQLLRHVRQAERIEPETVDPGRLTAV